MVANEVISCSRWPMVFAVDASTWDRCDAETSPERGFHYSASRHSAGQPIVAGWSYQWISQLDWAPDSWTAPLDAMRITPSMDATSATVDQVRRLVGLLPADQDVPLFVFDAGYDAVALGAGLADVRAQVLVRISPKRVFHPDPAPRPAGAVGRPRRHGDRFALSEPETWPDPDDELEARDAGARVGGRRRIARSVAVGGDRLEDVRPDRSFEVVGPGLEALGHLLAKDGETGQLLGLAVDADRSVLPGGREDHDPQRRRRRQGRLQTAVRARKTMT